MLALLVRVAFRPRTLEPRIVAMPMFALFTALVALVVFEPFVPSTLEKAVAEMMPLVTAPFASAGMFEVTFRFATLVGRLYIAGAVPDDPTGAGPAVRLSSAKAVTLTFNP